MTGETETRVNDILLGPIERPVLQWLAARMPGWVKPETQQLLDNALDWRMKDRTSISDLLPQVEDLVNRVEIALQLRNKYTHNQQIRGCRKF